MLLVNAILSSAAFPSHFWALEVIICAICITKITK